MIDGWHIPTIDAEGALCWDAPAGPPDPIGYQVETRVWSPDRTPQGPWSLAADLPADVLSWPWLRMGRYPEGAWVEVRVRARYAEGDSGGVSCFVSWPRLAVIGG
jgi:hypothetical protein